MSVYIHAHTQMSIFTSLKEKKYRIYMNNVNFLLYFKYLTYKGKLTQIN